MPLLGAAVEEQSEWWICHSVDSLPADDLIPEFGVGLECAFEPLDHQPPDNEYDGVGKCTSGNNEGILIEFPGSVCEIHTEPICFVASHRHLHNSQDYVLADIVIYDSQVEQKHDDHDVEFELNGVAHSPLQIQKHLISDILGFFIW